MHESVDKIHKNAFYCTTHWLQWVIWSENLFKYFFSFSENVSLLSLEFYALRNWVFFVSGCSGMLNPFWWDILSLVKKNVTEISKDGVCLGFGELTLWATTWALIFSIYLITFWRIGPIKLATGSSCSQCTHGCTDVSLESFDTE